MFKLGFRQYMLNRYKRSGDAIILHYECAIDGDFDWCNITKNNIERYQRYLSENIAPSSANTYLSILLTYIKRYAMDNGLKLPIGLHDIKKLKCGKSQSTYLTERDIKLFSKYIPENDMEYYVHRLFFICLLTGCRLSDAKEITLSKVCNGKFSYVAQKTKSLSSEMTIDDNILSILKDERYVRMQEQGCQLNTFIKHLKRICEKIGLTDNITLYQKGKYITKRKCDFITSHVGRRSAATNLYMRNPSSLLNISRMLGHSSTSQTEQYIKCVTEDTKSMRDYRSGFSLSGY